MVHISDKKLEIARSLLGEEAAFMSDKELQILISFIKVICNKTIDDVVRNKTLDK